MPSFTDFDVNSSAFLADLQAAGHAGETAVQLWLPFSAKVEIKPLDLIREFFNTPPCYFV